MRERFCILLIILILLLPIVTADDIDHITLQVVIDEGEIAPEAIAYGSIPTVWGIYESPNGMTIADDGTIFVASAYPYWLSIRGETPVTLAAFNSSGSLLWDRRAGTGDWVIYDLDIHDDLLCVTGTQNGDLFLGAYDLEGHSLWNTTWDWGNNDYGYTIGARIGMLEYYGFFETIMVGGVSLDYSDGSAYYFLVEFNETGGYVGHEMFEHFPSPCFGETSFFYIMGNDTIEKRADLVSKWWTKPVDEYRPLEGNDAGIYLIDFGPDIDTVLETVSYNTSLPTLMLNATVKWTNPEGTPFTRLGYSADVTNNGSLAVLLNVQNGEDLGWYHSLIKWSASVSSTTKLLNASWSHVNMKWFNDSKIYVAGYVENQGVSIAVFNTTQLSSGQSTGTATTETTSTTTQTTGGILGPEIILTVAAGVIVFDAVLIIFLKRKVSG